MVSDYSTISIMADIMTHEQRHNCMAAIKGKDTKPEMIVRRFLHSHGLRYGLHNRKLPGCPDLVLRRFKTVIFIHGCFWHGHANCRYYRLPKTNVDFWRSKIERNRERDKESKIKLENMGWNVIIIWECDLRNKSIRKEILEQLYKQFSDPGSNMYNTSVEAAEPKVVYGLDLDD